MVETGSWKICFLMCVLAGLRRLPLRISPFALLFTVRLGLASIIRSSCHNSFLCSLFSRTREFPHLLFYVVDFNGPVSSRFYRFQEIQWMINEAQRKCTQSHGLCRVTTACTRHRRKSPNSKVKRCDTFTTRKASDRMRSSLFLLLIFAC